VLVGVASNVWWLQKFYQRLAHGHHFVKRLLDMSECKWRYRSNVNFNFVVCQTLCGYTLPVWLSFLKHDAISNSQYLHELIPELLQSASRHLIKVCVIYLLFSSFFLPLFVPPYLVISLIVGVSNLYQDSPLQPWVCCDRSAWA
jgi:hypothetical protein